MKEENNVALVGMVLSIAGLILLITLVWAPLGLLLLVLWFILWIIWLFYRPKWKAIVAIVIPVIVCVAITCLISALWKSMKVPANQFGEWAQEALNEQEIADEDEDLFENIVNTEFEKLLNSKTEEDWKSSFETSEGSNIVEKGSYLFFGLLKEWMSNSLEQYRLQKENNVQALPAEENANEEATENTAVEDQNPEQTSEDSEVAPVAENKETVETFSDSELSDIEQIINILE